MNVKKKNAVKIGSFCITTYLVSYCARHVLSVLTPFLTETGAFSAKYLGTMASIYLIFYAAGQLVNGILGEHIHPKIMISAGCLLSGTGLFLFPVLDTGFAHMSCYAVLGFGLSMLRGPLMKIIAENTPPREARIICTLFSVASFAGPLVVSALSILFHWKLVFYIVAAFACGIGVVAYFLIVRAEQKGVIKFTPNYENIFSGLSSAFKIKHFIFYCVIAGIAEVSSSSISFWTPTYLNEYVALSTEMSAGVYSLMSLVSIFCPLLSVFLFDHVLDNDIKLNSVYFSLAVVAYVLLPFTRANAVINIMLFVVAKICFSCSSATLWSIYIPSMAQYGSVSIGHGVLDVTGYLVAAVVNMLFTTVLESNGWNGLIFFWVVIAVAGLFSTIVVQLRDRTLAKR